MRLTTKERQAIVTIAHKYFDKEAETYLFGSRVDDNIKGSDIDLYIIPKQSNSAEQLYTKKIKFLVALNLTIGEQKIDVVIVKDEHRVIEKEAKRTGIKL
ncbi:MAG: nucleotidyltransferase domain-containing protein [Methylococcaceae bacterium]